MLFGVSSSSMAWTEKITGPSLGCWLSHACLLPDTPQQESALCSHYYPFFVSPYSLISLVCLCVRRYPVIPAPLCTFQAPFDRLCNHRLIKSFHFFNMWLTMLHVRHKNIKDPFQ